MVKKKKVNRIRCISKEIHDFECDKSVNMCNK